MEGSRRGLSIDMVIHRGIFKTNLITLFPFFTFIPETGIIFYREVGLSNMYQITRLSPTK